VFGIGGTLDFTPISQDWLREAAKHWAAAAPGVSRPGTNLCRFLQHVSGKDLPNMAVAMTVRSSCRRRRLV
jgi:hypothetical protein